MFGTSLEDLGKGGDAFIETCDGTVFPVHWKRLSECKTIVTQLEASTERLIISCAFLTLPYLKVLEWIYRDVKPFNFREHKLAIIEELCDMLSMESLSIGAFLNILESMVDKSRIKDLLRQVLERLRMHGSQTKSSFVVACAGVVALGDEFWRNFGNLAPIRTAIPPAI